MYSNSIIFAIGLSLTNKHTLRSNDFVYTKQVVLFDYVVSIDIIFASLNEYENKWNGKRNKTATSGGYPRLFCTIWKVSHHSINQLRFSNLNWNCISCYSIISWVIIYL